MCMIIEFTPFNENYGAIEKSVKKLTYSNTTFFQHAVSYNGWLIRKNINFGDLYFMKVVDDIGVHAYEKTSDSSYFVDNSVAKYVTCYSIGILAWGRPMNMGNYHTMSLAMYVPEMDITSHKQKQIQLLESVIKTSYERRFKKLLTCVPEKVKLILENEYDYDWGDDGEDDTFYY